MVYKGFSAWEEDKSDYNSAKYAHEHKHIKYSDENKYGAAGEDKSGKDIYKKADEEEKKKKDDKKSIEDDVKHEDKYKKNKESEEEIKKKAAEEISKDMLAEKQNIKKGKKHVKTIEDAIKKAIEDEKKVCFID